MCTCEKGAYYKTLAKYTFNTSIAVSIYSNLVTNSSSEVSSNSLHIARIVEVHIFFELTSIWWSIKFLHYSSYYKGGGKKFLSALVHRNFFFSIP